MKSDIDDEWNDPQATRIATVPDMRPTVEIPRQELEALVKACQRQSHKRSVRR